MARIDRGGVVLAMLAGAALVTGVAAGCAARGSPAAAGPHSASGPAVTAGPSPDRRGAAARYLAIAVAGNRRLEIDFDRLDGPDRSRLSAADADLRDVAATEHLFDRRLLAIAFPPATEQVVRVLFTVNESRARLTLLAARSQSLAQLRSYHRRLAAANDPVEAAVRVIRRQLGLPPPETS